MTLEQITSQIRTIPDFPKPGILFRDMTPLLLHPEARTWLTTRLAEDFSDDGIEGVAGIEARGFLFGISLADALGVPFIPIRKSGKLPGRTERESYDLEYGQAAIEIHADAVVPGQRILIHDDLLATGGTCSAAARLIRRVGGTVAGFSFLISLEGLEGRKTLHASFPAPVRSIIRY